VINLNLGCGELVGEHWVNLDSSPNVFLDNTPKVKQFFRRFLPKSSRASKFCSVRYLDLRTKRWPFGDSSVDGIFSSHVFEHLTHEAGLHMLRECFRVLKPGGRIRFVLPCLEDQISRYLELKKKRDPLAATAFAKQSLVLPDLPEGPWWYRLYFQVYDKNRHRMFYDKESLRHYFEQSGFARVKHRGHLESKLPYLNEVEKADRFPGAFCLEAEKPVRRKAARPKARRRVAHRPFARGENLQTDNGLSLSTGVDI